MNAKTFFIYLKKRAALRNDIVTTLFIIYDVTYLDEGERVIRTINHKCGIQLDKMEGD